jgi:signal transduction histidine kinase
MVSMKTVKGRIIVAIVVVGCIPLLTGLLLAWMSGMRSLRDVIGGNLQAVAAQAADRVTMLMQAEVQSLRLLASAPLRVRQPVISANQSYGPRTSAVARVVRDRIEEWENGTQFSHRLLNSELSRFLLETKVRDGSNMVGLLITDQYGALVAASSEPDRYFFGDEPWWRAVHDPENPQEFISDIVPSRKGTFRTPDETIDIAVPIRDDHQRAVIGAIKVSYRFDALFRMINEIRIGQTGHAMLFNAAGQPLVCPILPRQAHRIHDQLMRLIVSEEPGWGIAEDDGHGSRDSVVGFAPVRSLPAPLNTWHVFVRQQPTESYAPIREQIRNLAIIGAIMVVLLALLGTRVAARIARPIQAIRHGVEGIGQGRYADTMTRRAPGDEVEELASVVTAMADHLQRSQQELDTLNQDLARRMEERTHEVAEHMRALELTERLAALGNVASGIAHEINNPLGIIINRIECMEAEASQMAVPHELVRDLQAIRSQAERILRVTRSMLSLSRGAAPTFKPIDVTTVIRSCLAMSAERMEARRVRLLCDLDRDVLPVMGDRDRLETVILNLVNNAVDAVQNRPEGDGRVSVQCRTIRNDTGNWVMIEVEDNGPGIPPKLRDRIFEPFFTTKPTGEGHGLGLFLCHAIVAEHRGRIELAETESGALFKVLLPVLPGTESLQKETAWSQQAKSLS